MPYKIVYALHITIPILERQGFTQIIMIPPRYYYINKKFNSMQLYQIAKKSKNSLIKLTFYFLSSICGTGAYEFKYRHENTPPKWIHYLQKLNNMSLYNDINDDLNLHNRSYKDFAIDLYFDAIDNIECNFSSALNKLQKALYYFELFDKNNGFTQMFTQINTEIQNKKDVWLIIKNKLDMIPFEERKRKRMNREKILKNELSITRKYYY